MKSFLDKRKDSRRYRRKRKEITQLSRYKATQLCIDLEERVLNRTDSGVGNSNQDEIIITLTTHSHRIDNVYLCIESLMRQTLKADKIILNLDSDQFNPSGLPDTLKLLQDRGLEIYYVPQDLGPYTKYFYTLSRFPNALMVTVDDDILYPIDLISKLYLAHLEEPDIIHCNRAHQMLLGVDGTLLPYKSWERNLQHNQASWEVFPTGVGGVIYFPGCFHDDVLNQERFMQLSPKADDVWLKAMTLLNGVKSKRVQECREWELRFPTIPDSQTVTLKRGNKNKTSGNDQKLKAVFEHYNISHFTDD